MSGGGNTRLYVIPGSHPSMAGRLMLEAKGIDYKRRDLIPVVSRLWLRAVGFDDVTVPALKIDGRRVQGTRAIARALDKIQAEPALLPSDPERLRAVEDAERWGDEVLQPAPRRIIWWIFKRDRAGLESLSEGARLGVPVKVAVKTAGPVAALAARFNDATDENVRADLAALPAWLDQVDALIEHGTIGGAAPNAADLQIATSIRLLLTFEDLAPLLAGRPCAALGLRLVPEYPGRIPAALPHEWMEWA